ncbi:MAG: hypothetical protein AB8H79_25180 [Myxococcota bacterium]
MRVFSCLIALAVACAPKGPPSAAPDASGAQRYKVGVVAANGGAVVTSITTFEAEPRGEGVWAFRTAQAEGTWEEGTVAMTWNSANPTAADPWPVTLQHAVATVFAAVRLDERGAPHQLLDQARWKAEARDAMGKTGLPAQASVGAAALLDADGILRDLRRNFPGTPNGAGAWVRPERLAGLPATRLETCTQARAKGVTTWTCSGRVEGPREGSARLVDATSTTQLVIDRKGLVQLDTEYSGTLVFLAPDGKRVIDRPIAGRRQVLRAPTP